MAQTKRYALNTSYQDGVTTYTGAEIARVHRILDSQLGGTLEALGTGVIHDPDETSFLVAGSAGLAVTVQPGRAFVRHSTLGGCLLQLDVALTLDDLDPDSSLHIFAALGVAEDNDSRESALPVILVQESDVCDGGVHLAVVTTSASSATVEDVRVPFTVDLLLQRVAQLETDLGYDAGERAKGTVAARLNLLAGDEGATPGAATFLEQLKYSVADPRNAVVVIEEKLAANLAAAIEAAQAGGEFASPSETDQIWSWLLGLRRTEGKAAPNLLRFLPGSGAEPGLHGTDSAPDTQQFDQGGTLPAVPEEREYSSE